MPVQGAAPVPARRRIPKAVGDNQVIDMNPKKTTKVAAAAGALAAIGVALLVLLPNASAFTVIDSPTSDASSSCSTAKTMTTMSDISARGELSLPSDQWDNFRWYIYRTEKMSFQVTEDSSAQVYQALSRDHNCTIGPSFSQTTVTNGRHQFTGSIKATGTGYYNLQVYALAGSGSGYYWVTYSTDQDDANSGGDASDSASFPTTIGSSSVSGLVSPRYGGDDDYYRVTVPGLATYKVTLDQDGSSTSIDMTLAGKTTVSSSTGSVTGTKSLYCINPTPNPVQVTVRVFQSGSGTTGTGAYTLSPGSGTSTVASESTIC